MARGVKSSLEVVRQVWAQAGLPVGVLERTVRAGHVELSHDPSVVGQAVRGSFQITAVAQGITAAIALAHRFYLALQAVEQQHHPITAASAVDTMVLDSVSVDARHALAEYKGWTRLYTGPPTSVAEMLTNSIPTDSDVAKSALSIDPHAVADWDPLAGLYRTKPNPDREIPGIVRIHTNFPHHKLGILQLLHLAPQHLQWNEAGIHDVFARYTKDDVQREVEKWDAFQLEAQAQEKGLCVTAYRSEDEWSASEMGKAVRAWMDEVGGSAFRITRIPCSTRAASHSSSTKNSRSRDEGRMKVVDMSRVIAGPISTRTLAALGADVLLISSPHLPNLPLRELETARGKRTAFVTLPASAALPAEMEELVRCTDVFSQAYRPQGLSGRGLGPDDVQALRPGIVYAELCAFGFTGPWANRRAYDSLTQTACGMNWLESLSHRDYVNGQGAGEGEGVEPRALPVQALDYAAGSLMCFATLACRCRAILERMRGEAKREEEGWRVQVSLASTAEWIKGLGQIHGEEAWWRPPKDVLPSVEEGLLDMVSSYKVRGLKRSATDDREAEVSVLAIRHASVEAAQDGEKEDLRWTVPAHLGADELRW